MHVHMMTLASWLLLESAYGGVAMAMMVVGRHTFGCICNAVPVTPIFVLDGCALCCHALVLH